MDASVGIKVAINYHRKNGAAACPHALLAAPDLAPRPGLDPRPSFQRSRLAAPVSRCWALTLALALALTLSLSPTQVWATSSHRCTPSSTPTSYHPSSLRTCASPNPNPGNRATPTLTPNLTPNLTPTRTLAPDPGH